MNIIRFVALASIVLLSSACSKAQEGTPLPVTVPPATQVNTPSNIPANTATTSLSSSIPPDANALSITPGYPAPITSSEQAGYPGPAIGMDITPLPKGTLPEAPSDDFKPKPGKAALSGVFYSLTMSQVLAETGAYLSPATGTEKKDPPRLVVGPRDQYGDIQFTSDKKGEFRLDSVAPGNYYLLVWAPTGWVIAQKSSADTTPMLIELKADQTQKLGVIYLPWP